jgi:hypothetical protein
MESQERQSVTDNVENLADIKEFLQNTFIEKRFQVFHARRPVKAREERDEKVAKWLHKVHTLGPQFREAALLNCSERTRESILDFSDHLRKICFIQGLASYRIQTMMRNRNYKNFDIAETALVEESAL